MPAIGEEVAVEEEHAIAVAAPDAAAPARRGRGRPRRVQDPNAELEAGPNVFRFQGRAGMFTYQVPVQQSDLEACAWWPSVTLWSLAQERAPTTGRLHTHCFFQFRAVMDCSKEQFTVLGAVPNISTRRTGRYPQRTWDQGHFYLQVEEKYCMAQTNHPHSDFDVFPNWVMSLWRHKKISDPVPILVRHRILTPHLLRIIEATKDQEARESRRAFKASFHQRCQDSLESFHVYEIAEEWLRQMAEHHNRYKFLVVCGDTQLGKTNYVRSLVNGPLFEHSGVMNWAGYNPSHHQFIMIDDLPEWEAFVLANKPLFQSNTEIWTQTSTTNCYARMVDVVQKGIIVVTNDAPRQSYVTDNCFLLRVYGPMWSRPQTAASSSDQAPPPVPRIVHSVV